MYIHTDVQVQPCSSQRRPCCLCLTGDSAPGQILALSAPGKALDASRLQAIHYAPGKLIKGEGKSVDLRVENLAASQILSIDEMVISGQSLKGFDPTAKMPGESCGAERVLVLPLGSLWEQGSSREQRSCSSPAIVRYALMGVLL